MCNPPKHVWLWDSSTTYINPTPDDNARCECHMLTWAEARELAIGTLRKAESQRQAEREAEAECWRRIAEAQQQLALPLSERGENLHLTET